MQAKDVRTVDGDLFDEAFEKFDHRWNSIEILWDRRSLSCRVSVAGGGSRTPQEMREFIRDCEEATKAAEEFPYNGMKPVYE